MENIVSTINSYIWSDVLVYLFLGLGIVFSFMTRFVQLRHMGTMVRLLFKKKEGDEGISPFQAFAITVSGAVGTGNIAGVATAIAFGGPGAIFWMWTIAFLGGATSFIENTLGQSYKMKDKDGNHRGGPAYAIEKGLGMKWYGMLFAASTLVAMGLFLPGVQSNTIASSVSHAFGIENYVIGLVLVAVVGFIIFGGIQRIAHFAQSVVPFMAISYVLVALVVIFYNFSEVPGIFKLIFSSAFGIEATFGGIVGTAISWGVKRGVYSNEAGQGSASQSSSAANVKHPAQQGIVQVFAIYFDTWFICTATALMILLMGTYNTAGAESGTFLYQGLPGVEAGPVFTQKAIDGVISGVGSPFVAIAVFFFALTTLIAYYYMAEVNLAYFYKDSSTMNTTMIMIIFKIIFLGSIYYSTIRSSALAWGLGDIGVGLMAWLNMISLIFLVKIGVKVLNDYEKQKKEGVDEPVFDPEKLGLKNMDYWKK